ncbi:MAG: hypothetical protein ACI9HB_000327 [Gammaproteobacteria bacterium]
MIGKINSRPRKCLGFKTPNQLFLGPNQHVALASLIRVPLYVDSHENPVKIPIFFVSVET